MLVPKVKASEFKKFGFKRCKGIPKELECYYLCVARGCKMLFVSNVCFAVNEQTNACYGCFGAANGDCDECDKNRSNKDEK